METSLKIFVSKWAHLWSAVAVFVVALISYICMRELYKDESTTLGTISVLLAIYGILFALIELRRTRNAAVVAEKQASRVFEAVVDLITAREITECQMAVESALDAIDRGSAIPSMYIVRIVRLYSQVFPTEVADDQSQYRKNRTMIESYRFSEVKPTKSNIPGKTKLALTSISGHLAELQGSTKKYEGKL